MLLARNICSQFPLIVHSIEYLPSPPSSGALHLCPHSQFAIYELPSDQEGCNWIKSGENHTIQIVRASQLAFLRSTDLSMWIQPCKMANLNSLRSVSRTRVCVLSSCISVSFEMNLRYSYFQMSLDCHSLIHCNLRLTDLFLKIKPMS